MFQMFRQLFSSITVFFMALEKIAFASNHLASWAEESSGAFADEARIQRQAKLNALKGELAQSQQDLKQVTNQKVPTTTKAPRKPTVRKT